jgi:hypothetical protein
MTEKRSEQVCPCCEETFQPKPIGRPPTYRSTKCRRVAHEGISLAERRRYIEKLNRMMGVRVPRRRGVTSADRVPRNRP